ncbi:MAG: SagB/ThcOx family dehydrogenase [Candidatus Omnitrophota bacterium]
MNRRSAVAMACFTALFLVLSGNDAAVFPQEERGVIRLKSPQLFRGKKLMMALKERRSSRSFDPKMLPNDVLSGLLWAGFGINRSDSGKRTAPSAMNWQEIEIYVAMENGLYLYRPKESTLVPVLGKDIRKFVGMQEYVKEAPISLIYVADFEKMTGSEQDKIWLAACDAGFISQNVHLYCASEELATVTVAWIDKPRLEKVMGLRKDQKVVIAQPVGYKKN